MRGTLLLATLLIVIRSSAVAMSDGNYSPEEMGCKPEGNAFDPVNDPDGVHDPDAGADHCQAARIAVGTDGNPNVLRIGLDHEEPGSHGFAGGHNPHHGTIYVGSPGQEITTIHYGTGVQRVLPADLPLFGAGGDGALSDDHEMPELTITEPNADGLAAIDQSAPNEIHLFFGADDNLESGEHDGVPERNCEDDGNGGLTCYDNVDLANGPSDGGAVRLDLAPSAADPAYLGVGACVDGICFNSGTGERRVYDGGRDGRVYLDDATVEDYADEGDFCSYDNEGNCVRQVHDAQQDFHSRPGLNLYADPDPQDSSIGPFDGSTNTHVGSGGVKVLGVSIIDAQELPASASTAETAESAAEATSPCCASACVASDADGNCVAERSCRPGATDVASLLEHGGLVGCTELGRNDCFGGSLTLGGQDACLVIGGVATVGGVPVAVEDCTAAAVAACCDRGACD